MEWEKDLFEEAYGLAERVHALQLRDEGSPYIRHIDGILEILNKELELDDYNLMTIAALHDVLEDSDEITEEYLLEHFDEHIAAEVSLLTKTDEISTEEYLRRMEEYDYKLHVIIIKLADRLHNVRSLVHILDLNPKKVQRYLEETETYYLPLAIKYEILDEELRKAMDDIAKYSQK